jgi:hypothetical protein
VCGFYHGGVGLSMATVIRRAADYYRFREDIIIDFIITSYPKIPAMRGAGLFAYPSAKKR